MGYGRAFRGGLSFSLNDIRIPDAKQKLISEASEEVEGIFASYNMGLITNNERYNQVIDVWTNTNARLTQEAMSTLINDRQGFNPIYMMLDSGARGSKEQIRQLSGMRGLMAKPQKSGSAGGEIIENPIISNFKEGLSILEYFISTHGARKGLADTALKTADAGYLTRRLHDVAQDVVVNEVDCGTLRGLEVTALKKSEEIVETLAERIIGRVSLNDVVDPLSDEVYIEAGELITEEIANKIDASAIETVEVRSPLTCATKRGICEKCYGTNLATNKGAQQGDSVGVIAAQSIGEPGTQLTLRTFHVGGTAGNVSEENKILAKFDGKIELEDVRTVDNEDGDKIVIGRTGEMRLVDVKTGRTVMTNNIPYGGILKVKDGQ
ncbi:MAG: DNA-directed RNA polymerase subunit beta', partial [Schleiferiaceae bacterium]